MTLRPVRALSKCLRAASAGAAGLAAVACAGEHGPNVDPEARAAESKVDPFEGPNRGIFAFNEGIDQWLLEPVARGWDDVVPESVQSMFSNFYANLRFPTTFANDLFQAKPKAAAVTAGRFVLNTGLGFFGFFDTATALGLEKREEDFGQTLGYWGLGPGPYIMIPFLGPSDARDLTGVLVDLPLSAPTWFVSFWITGPARIVQIVNARAAYLETVDENRRSAFDYYTFTRDAYLSYREAQIADGQPQETRRSQEHEKELYFPETEDE